MIQIGKDRRRWVRHKFYAPVRISCEHANHSSIVEGRCLMLSEGGMSLFVAANVPVGTRVKIDFITTASDHGISVEGTIRNRMVYLYGIEY
jgi:c-di-GMP-binding flagellar brake protein YcgR